jgi:ribokinase
VEQTSIVVVGALNTDIIAAGIDQFPRPNDPIYGGKLVIGPGGKPGNIASMAGRLAPTGSVAIISKTVADSYGLWRQPMDGLERAGVNTDFVTVLQPSETPHMPSVALVAVDRQGDNMCFVVPGISQEFSEADVDTATPLFEAAAHNKGILALTLECPIPAVHHAMAKAKALGMRVAFDPGGIVKGADITELLREQPYLFKPNEFEAKIITGIEITDFDTAAQAASKLTQLGAQNVLITHGERGAYLFADGGGVHIPIPEVPANEVKDATGCGDQSMAVLCVYLQAGKPLKEAAEAAVLAGTLQFHKLGIQPVTKEEMQTQL